MEFENKAKIAEAEGDFLSALKYYQKALDSLRAMQLEDSLRFDFATILQRIANLYTEIGNYQKAIEYYQQAINLYLESDAPLTKIYRLIGECRSNIGACNLVLSNLTSGFISFQEAAENYKKAASLEDPVLQKYVIDRVILNMALAALCLISGNKKPKEALNLLEKALVLGEEFKLAGIAVQLTQYLSHLLRKEYLEARKILEEQIEDSAEALLFTSSLRATVMGIIIDLAAKHVPEAKYRIKDQIIEEKGEVLLTIKIYQDLLLFGLAYANQKLPRAEWKEVMGLLVGKLKKENVIISEVVPMTHGSEVEVEFKNEHYIKTAMIDSRAAERNEFIVGWYHTHPGLGLFLSPTDVINQLGYQSSNPKAIAIVFDFTQLTPLHPGFSIFRLDDPSLGAASSYHTVRWRIKDASKHLFADMGSFFDNFLMTLNQLISQAKTITLTDLAAKLSRSEDLLIEILPQLTQYLPNIHYNPTTRIFSAK
ncbi:MAG: tetratricopeptide repeat protein [Candidatus Helarchaeota archaeon]